MAPQQPSPQMPQQGAPQIPPQLLAMLAQRMQQGQQGAPAPQGPRPMPVPPPQGIAPGAAMLGRAAMAQPMPMQLQQGQQMGLQPQEAAAMGRFGDTVLSHLKPGEIVINPQLLPPALIQAIMQAFQHAGVDPRSMIVGSQQAPHNPKTGMEEHNGFLSSVLPLALGIGGSLLAPELLPALGLEGSIGATAASAIGGGLGSAAGTALGGGNIGQDVTSGLTSAAGNALAGHFLGGGGEGAAGSGSGSAGADNFPSPSTTPFGNPANASLASQYAAQGSGGLQGSMLNAGAGSGIDIPGGNPGTVGNNGWFGGSPGPMSTHDTILRGLGSGLGGLLGQGLAPATAKFQLPQGSIPYYNPAGPNPNSGAPGQPTFAGYNPIQSVTGQPYNFFPTPG